MSSFEAQLPFVDAVQAPLFHAQLSINPYVAHMLPASGVHHMRCWIVAG